MTLSVSLRHRFGRFSLDADFETGPGVTALFGRSGAGKTTIAHAVAGLIRPDAGRVRIGERLVLDTGSGVSVPKHRRRIGYVFQDARLFDHINVRGNLLFGRFFAPRHARRRAATDEFGRIVELLGLGPLLGRQPRLLSGGEKQRVAIGRALLSAPAALIMDEPLASLDDERKAEILPYLERLRERHLPILYISHSISEIVRLATNLVALSEGRVARVGPVGDVMSDPTLFPLMGRHEGGATINARIRAHDMADGLTELESGAGPLIVPLVPAPAGTLVRVHIRARDVMIALTRPEGLSALNVLATVVAEIGATDTPLVDVRLQAGPDTVLARITRRSFHALRLQPGRQVFAVLKSAAIARRDLTLLGP